MNIKVRLSKFQRDELSHKLDIMLEGFDGYTGLVLEGYMAHHYGFTTINELETLQAKVDVNPKAPSRIIEFTTREAVVALGELENAYDIATDNAAYTEEAGCINDARKLKQAVERFKEAMA